MHRTPDPIDTPEAQAREPQSLGRDTRGLAAYVAVAVLIAMALLVYGGAKIFGDDVNTKFEEQAGAVQNINGSLGGGGGGGEGWSLF